MLSSVVFALSLTSPARAESVAEVLVLEGTVTVVTAGVTAPADLHVELDRAATLQTGEDVLTRQG